MLNLRGGVKGRGKSQNLSRILIASFYWLEEEIKFYGWPMLLPIISQAFRGGVKERITWRARSFKGERGRSNKGMREGSSFPRTPARRSLE